MPKEKVMLIAGCSHAAGSEIDGNQDSKYNREHSFGGVLAKKMEYRPVNISAPGSTNPTIARSIIEWIDTEYDSEKMELFVLVAWTDSVRMEIPADRINPYHLYSGNAADWSSRTSEQYSRILLGYEGDSETERKQIAYYHRFISDNYIYLGILTLNLVLQVQYFLKMKNINYLMCNTMALVENNIHGHMDFYFNQVDQNKYIWLTDSKKSFYWRFRDAGFVNQKAKYWHHGEEPHRIFANELYEFIKEKYVFV